MIVNEIFRSIQGEGAKVGEPTTFVRFSGCNLQCPFCDTNHGDGRVMGPEDIIAEVKSFLPAVHRRTDYHSVTLTGGEPLRVDEIEILILMLVTEGFRVRVETNGMFFLDDSLWGLTSHQLYITCSPKEAIELLRVQRIDCLKILYPYLPEVSPREFNELNDPRLCGAVKIIQPITPPGDISPSEQMDVFSANCKGAISEAEKWQGWKVIPQVHKLINVR